MHFPTLFGTSSDITFKRWDDAPCPIDLTASREYQPVREEIQGWINAIATGKEPPGTGHDGRMAVSIAAAAYASVEEGRPITPR